MDVIVNEIKAYLHYPPSFYYFHVQYISANDPNNTSSSAIIFFGTFFSLF